ncbi:helix-turn-helix protein [Stackebrandtia albiflava]|uniref:Helix-turn-helix protein n=1 Tax=Stackebrandtia albiflava TaxID=406432 RepID=A0A562V0X9_9ACTN|nr:helix-turn-helix transcriptional regulator [Stackebrandtia albiflava]TWJ11463.1 helix-turn-helix protein [Stackebrandtia albiflava]
MSREISPTVSLRVLGAKLRAYRNQHGYTLEVAARTVSYHPGSLSKAESGKLAIHPSIVESLLDFYGVTDTAVRDDLIELARQGRRRGWWHKYRDLMTVAYIGLESAATSIYSLENHLVPGLLQVPEYFRAVLIAELGQVNEEQIERRALVRSERQKILMRREAPCELWAVLDESVLHRPIGSRETMAKQFDHLLEMSTLRNVTIQIMPYSAGAHASLSTRFTVLHFADLMDPGTVFLEQLHWRDDFVEEPHEVKRFIDAFDHVRAAAEPPARSAALIARARDNFRRA